MLPVEQTARTMLYTPTWKNNPITIAALRKQSHSRDTSTHLTCSVKGAILSLYVQEKNKTKQHDISAYFTF